MAFSASVPIAAPILFPFGSFFTFLPLFIGIVNFRTEIGGSTKFVVLIRLVEFMLVHGFLYIFCLFCVCCPIRFLCFFVNGLWLRF